MDRIKKFEFTCTVCGKDYYTYIEEDKLKELYSRTKLIKEIFPNYDVDYRELFLLKTCPICKELEHNYAIPVESSTNADDDKLQTDLIDMFDTASRA